MKLWVSALQDRDHLIQTHKIRHIVSLLSPSFALPRLREAADHLDLRFHDIPKAAPGFRAASEEDVEKLFTFHDRFADFPVLLHCYAGISRSTAAAYLLAVRGAEEGREHDLALALRKLSPSATPNPRLIALGDQMLNRGGRMIAAVQAIGRGAEAFAGLPFAWSAERL